MKYQWYRSCFAPAHRRNQFSTRNGLIPPESVDCVAARRDSSSIQFAGSGSRGGAVVEARARGKFVWILSVFFNCVCGTPLFAQGSLDVASGPRDVLYSQSKLMQSINQAWFI